MKEYRKHKRETLVSCFEVFEANQQFFIGYLAEISNGGMMLMTDNSYEVQHSAQISILLPEDVEDGGKIEVVAKSVRCDNDPDLSLFNIGFQFEDISSENLEKVAKLTEAYKFFLAD